MSNVFMRWVGVLGFIFSSFTSHAADIDNASALRSTLGLQSYLASQSVSSAVAGLSIAILDNGFSGAQPGTNLPASAEIIQGPGNPQLPTNHGTGMAQIVWSQTGRDPRGPKFYLINSNGFTNFKAAIDFMIARKISVVLYSQVWTFGGNFDGTGLIDAEVSRATQAGILWINAAGNFGGLVRNERVEEYFSSPRPIRFQNAIDDHGITVHLTWNDFGVLPQDFTSKDLDLVVRDAQAQEVGRSSLKQLGQPQSTAHPDYSGYARETVVLARLPRGIYSVEVEDRSHNFQASDRFRVMLQGDRLESVRFLSHERGFELLPPADHPEVITVGDRSALSAQGPTLGVVSKSKPEIQVKDSRVLFSNGTLFQGSSTAAAMVAGGFLLAQAARPDFGFKLALRIAEKMNVSSDLVSVPSSQIPSWLWPVVPADGSVATERTTRHWVVLTKGDPILLPAFVQAHAYRNHPSDILVASPLDRRWLAVPAAQALSILPPWVEFRQFFPAESSFQLPQLDDLLHF